MNDPQAWPYPRLPPELQRCLGNEYVAPATCYDPSLQLSAPASHGGPDFAAHGIVWHAADGGLRSSTIKLPSNADDWQDLIASNGPSPSIADHSEAYASQHPDEGALHEYHEEDERVRKRSRKK